MQTTTQGTEITVAILMDDLTSAKEIAAALRQKQVLPHHYQNLDEFWVAVNLQTPDLVLVDVTKMSQGAVQFKTHPKVLDGTMKYAFFSKESTRILLQSTLGLKPYGYLNQDPSLPAQVNCLLERRLEEIKREKEVQEMQQRVQRLQARSQRLISERSEAEEFRAHFEFIRNLCAEIEQESARLDFTHSLINKLEKWEAIDGYGIYELNQNGQKLISPELARKKYHPFPALWLGQANPQGIEEFARDMALQVANDLFESDPVMIKIHGGSNNPEMVLFVASQESRMSAFPWDLMESMLSSSYRRLKLFKQLPQYSSQFVPMWEALDDLDKLTQDNIGTGIRVLGLSLIPLTAAAKKRPQNKFYWAAFFNDFFLQLSGRIQKSTKLSLFGPWHVMFFIPQENFETESIMLQAFIQQFSYWKFFEDNSLALTEQMLPHLKLIPASSAHYLRLFEKEFEEHALDQEAQRLTAPARPRVPRLST
jgi:hypothetical protein